MIPVATSVRIWIASGQTDMRKGMQGLPLLVQEGLDRDPFVGDVFVFRGRAGSLIKALWHDGIGPFRRLGPAALKRRHGGATQLGLQLSLRQRAAHRSSTICS
jgi:hypothetical protein